MTKSLRNKIQIFFFIVVIFITIPFFIAGCSEKMIRYDNFTYMVSFEFPDNWKAVEDDCLIGGKPARFEGGSGFFQIALMNGQNISIDEFAANESQNKLNPYGSNPKIEKTAIRRREAVFIFPSPDQPDEMNNQACLIIKFPHSVVIGEEEYNYIMLWADKKHIKDMANSFYFIAY
jgi:TolB protein